MALCPYTLSFKDYAVSSTTTAARCALPHPTGPLLSRGLHRFVTQNYAIFRSL